MADRKYSDEYNRGRETGERGETPDYSQATVELMLDFLAGYKVGKRERAKGQGNVTGKRTVSAARPLGKKNRDTAGLVCLHCIIPGGCDESDPRCLYRALRPR